MYIALSGARFPLQLAYKCKINLAFNEFFFLFREFWYLIKGIFLPERIVFGYSSFSI